MPGAVTFYKKFLIQKPSQFDIQEYNPQELQLEIIFLTGVKHNIRKLIKRG